MAAKKKYAWVLQYEHRHGTDISVWSSQEKAKACVVAIMEQYMDDYAGRARLNQTGEEAAAELRKLIADGDLGEAMQQWGDRLEEWFTYEAYEIK